MTHRIKRPVPAVFLILCLFAWLPGVTISTAQAAEQACPTVGAIRWDAWFGDKGVPGRAVEKSLSPRQWHDRVPVCTQVVGTDKVRIACDTDVQMAREIEDAHRAGMSYWAFVAYPEDDPMSLGLRTFLRSKNKDSLNFALVSELDKWGNRSLYRSVIERYVHLFKQPNYQRVEGGRPLFFLGFVGEKSLDARFGGKNGFSKIVTEFRSLARESGVGDPYIVLLESNLERGRTWVAELGLDAIGAYAIADNAVRHGDYRQLASLAHGFWDRSAAADLHSVPLAMSGWDRRPRVQNPVPWEKGQFSEEQMERYYRAPTPEQLEDHVGDALRWVVGHPQSASANTVLIYAWNEFDEGGWLAPTLADGNSRLDAVKRAMDSVCSSSHARH